MQTMTVPGAQTGTYVIDPSHSRLGFSVRSLVMKVRGTFAGIEGSGHFDAADPASSRIELRLDAASIDTANAKRDEHLRSEDFLDAGAHPDITFVSTAVEVLDRDQFRVTGDLTIKGTTRPVAVDVRCTGASTDESGVPRADFDGRAVLRRKDWGVRWNPVLEGDGLVISDKVVVDFTLSTVRRDAP